MKLFGFSNWNKNNNNNIGNTSMTTTKLDQMMNGITGVVENVVKKKCIYIHITHVSHLFPKVSSCLFIQIQIHFFRLFKMLNAMKNGRRKNERNQTNDWIEWTKERTLLVWADDGDCNDSIQIIADSKCC